MKKLALLILIIFVLWEVVVITQAKESSVPYIRFDHEMQSFGKINQGDKVTRVFKVENVGNADLVIQRVKSTCGCTATSISSETIKPGEMAEIEVVFDSKRYHGTVTKSIYVESNDPQMPHKTLTIFGEIRPSSPEINISIDPEEWKFFALPGEETTEKIMIRNGGQQQLRIKAITTSSSQYEVSIPIDKIPSPDDTSATLEIKPDEGSESSSGYIYLEIAIPFTLFRKGPVRPSVSNGHTDAL